MDLDVTNIKNDDDLMEYINLRMHNMADEEKKGFAKLCSDLGKELIKERKNRTSMNCEKAMLEERCSSILAELNLSNEKRNKLEQKNKDLQIQCRESFEKHRNDLEEETKKRKELHSQFEDSIQDISKRLDEERLQRENQSQYGQALHDKVVTVLNEYSTKEKQYQLQLEKNQVELELANSKYQQQCLINEDLKNSFQRLQDKLMSSLQREDLLKNQLTNYNAKFDTITDLVTKNKETLVQYQEELKKISETNKSMSNENELLVAKTRKNEALLVDAEKVRLNYQSALNQLTSQRDQLQKYCSDLLGELEKHKV